MNRLCVVVADRGGARFFEAQPVDAPRVKTTLVERAVLDNPGLRELGASVTGRARTETNTSRQAGPVHPIGAQRERHRLEHERQLGRKIVRQVQKLTRGWTSGAVMLIAGPRLLGLTREALREALPAGIVLKELERDYVGLSAAEIRDRVFE